MRLRDLAFQGSYRRVGHIVWRWPLDLDVAEHPPDAVALTIKPLAVADCLGRKVEDIE